MADFPEQNQLDDFTAWYDDLGLRGQETVDQIPTGIDLLPEFCKKWTVAELWSAIRDYIGT